MNASILETLGRQARRTLPPRLIHHPDYFLVRRLCGLAKSGDNSYRPVLSDRLRRVLTNAVAYVPHYQDAGVTLAQCRNEDPFHLIQEFPFLTKDSVIANPERFLSSRVPRFVRYKKSSSGSSGQGIVLWRTKQTADVEKAFLDQQWAPWGWSAAHSLILRMGDDARQKLEDYPVARHANRLMVSPLHLTDTWLDRIYDDIVAFGPEFVHAYSSCAFTLARFIVETRRPPLSVRAVMLTSEPLPRRWIPTLQKGFAADISIHYGLTERTNFAETTVPLGESALHYRLNPIYGHQENFVHDDGRHEIVGTSYWNTVMPLIRYRTGDFGTIKDGELSAIDGRDIEHLVAKNGKPIPGLSVEPDMEVWRSVSRLQIYQPRPGEVVFRVIPKGDVSRDDLDRVLASFKPLWGDFFDMSLDVVDDIPGTAAGKMRFVSRDGASST